MAVQEQRITLCSNLALAGSAQVIGFGGSATLPLNLQDISNSGIPSVRAWSALGVELVWTGSPVGLLTVQGSISGLVGAFAPLSSPIGGSCNPDFIAMDDAIEDIPTPPTFGSQTPNPAVMGGFPSVAFLTWDLTKLRINYLNVLSALSTSAGNLTCTISLTYLT